MAAFGKKAYLNYELNIDWDNQFLDQKLKENKTIGKLKKLLHNAHRNPAKYESANDD